MKISLERTRAQFSVNRSWLIPIASFCAFVFALSYYFASPLFALVALRGAAESGDRDRLEQIIDFTAVKNELKSQMTVQITNNIGDSTSHNTDLISGIGTVIVPTLVDKAVDNYVTPAGIATMVRTGQLQYHGSDSKLKPNDFVVNGDRTYIVTDMGYVGLDRFRVRVRRKLERNNILTLVLERRGMLDWKLIRIDLPRIDFDEKATPGIPPATVATSELPRPEEVDKTGYGDLGEPTILIPNMTAQDALQKYRDYLKHPWDGVLHSQQDTQEGYQRARSYFYFAASEQPSLVSDRDWINIRNLENRIERFTCISLKAREVDKTNPSYYELAKRLYPLFDGSSCDANFQRTFVDVFEHPYP